MSLIIPTKTELAAQASGTEAPDVLISVRNVSKTYLVYNDSLDRLRQAFVSRSKRQYYHTVAALTDVSFDLKRGKSLGIIGRNGSGKSTLLQLIAGTLAPTSGEIQTYGRIAALLELGSGFNPEFTGRENVLINGTIMGLTRRAMDEHYQEIVDFADIGEFIDMPVKTYSSGMLVRLAFATAINVEADVLLIDEALAVGDASFQEKCFERLERLIARGTTLLFVSHDTESVGRLCGEALLLDRGRQYFYGHPREAIDQYFQLWTGQKQAAARQREAAEPPPEPAATVPETAVSHAKQDGDLDALLGRLLQRNVYCRFEEEGRWGDRQIELIGLYLVGDDERDLPVVEFDQYVNLILRCRANQDLEAVDIGFHVRDLKSLPLIAMTNFNMPAHVGPIKAGQEVVLKYRFKPRLRSGHYFIVAGIGGHPPGSVYYDWLPHARIFELADMQSHQPSGWGMTMPETELEFSIGGAR